MNNDKNIPSAESSEDNKDLPVKTINRILILLICVLLIYILGVQVIEMIKTNADNYISEIITSQCSTENTTYLQSVSVNINSDSIYELMQLDGIGEAKAKEIIKYRKENGDFVSIEELLKVPGIGESVYEKIKNNLTIE